MWSFGRATMNCGRAIAVATLNITKIINVHFMLLPSRGISAS